MIARHLRRLAAAVSLGLLTGAASGPSTAAEEGKPRILVVVSHEAAQYRDAVNGFRQALAQHRVSAVVDEVNLQRDAKEANAALENAARERYRVVFTLGTQATEAALAQKPGLPVVAGLVLNADVIAKGANATGVMLQVPARVQFDWMQRVLPAGAKIAVLYNPRENQARVEEAQRIAHEAGFELVPFQVVAPQSLPNALENAVNHADALWVVPDSVVVSPETAKSLLLASFRNRIPLIGLSSAWVKAGALFALDWDYNDVGSQCAELAIQALAGTRPGSIAPLNARRYVYALNLRTAREMRVNLSEPLISSAAQVYE